MPLAIPYIRFSTKDQLSGSSLERQQAAVNNWLGRHPGFDLSPETYADLGLSGTGAHIERGRLGALLVAIESGMIPAGSVILIEAVDRLTRLEPLEAIGPLKTIVKAGIVLVDLESDTWYDRNALQGDSLLMFLFKARAAYEYSVRLSNRIRSSYDSRAKDLQTGAKQRIKKRQGFWLTSEGVLIPEQAVIVQDVFRRFLNAEPLRSIYRAHGNVFANTASVRKLLRNRVVIGDWPRKKVVTENGKRRVVDGELLKGVFDAAITEADFYQAQTLLDKTSTPGFTNTRKFPLAGLFYCSECEAKLLFVNAGPNTVTDRLKCPNRNSGEHSCTNSFTLPVPVATYFAAHTSSPYVYRGFKNSRLPELARRRIELQGRLEAVEKQIQATSLRMDAEPENPAHLQEFKARVHERKALQSELAAMQEEPEVTDVDLASLNIRVSDHSNREALDPLMSDFLEYIGTHDEMSMNRTLQLGDYGVWVTPDGVLVVRDRSLFPIGQEEYWCVLEYTGYDRKQKAFKVHYRGEVCLINGAGEGISELDTHSVIVNIDPSA